MDQWLAREFAPHRLTQTLQDMASSWQCTTGQGDREDIASKITGCDRELARYRVALDAGASPAAVAAWIAETEAEKASYQLSTRPAQRRPRMTEAEVKGCRGQARRRRRSPGRRRPRRQGRGLPAAIPEADLPPGRRLVEAQIEVPHWQTESVRGPSRNLHAWHQSPCLRSSALLLVPRDDGQSTSGAIPL